MESVTWHSTHMKSTFPHWTVHVKMSQLISVRAGAFAFGNNGILDWYPSAFESTLSLQAPPSQNREMGGFGRFANHPFWKRTRPFAVAAAHLHVAGPESAPQVLPCMQHRTESIVPQPQLKPSSELLAGLVLFTMRDLKLHGFDVFGHGAGGTQL